MEAQSQSIVSVDDASEQGGEGEREVLLGRLPGEEDKQGNSSPQQ
jgi:hypothetical protein